MLEFLRIEIQIHVVETITNFYIDQFGEYFHIHYIARLWVYFARHVYNQLVVVTVVIGVVALSKNSFVGGIIPVGIVKAMRCIEVRLP